MDQGKPHAVCVPFPMQGHINPMLKFAKILHQNGFHITFVISEFNHRFLLESCGNEALEGLPSFRFETIPDGLPPSDDDTTRFVPSLFGSTATHCLAPFKDLLARLNDTCNSEVPPVSCIVSDGIMSFTLEAAQELGVPDVFFWCASACGYMGYMQYEKLLHLGVAPLKDESYLTDGYLEQVLDWIPGMKGIRLKDLPAFIRTTNADDPMIKFVVQEMDRAKKASAIVLNTFEDLEHDVITGLSSFLPPVYPIGPLTFLLDQVNDESLNSLGLSLWKEESECLQWLDSKEPHSVVYVNFGSLAFMSPEQLFEFAWGLANSKQPFLWIIRPDLVQGGSDLLPPDFLEETKDRGMLATWCPQENVLAHRSVGGFLTHSGWNSAMESISSGVPMICWPAFGDQVTNSRYCCGQWGIGMEISVDVKRDEVERSVRELMVGEKGKEMKKMAMTWKNSAEEAADKARGSSSLNLMNLINQVLLP